MPESVYLDHVSGMIAGYIHGMTTTNQVSANTASRLGPMLRDHRRRHRLSQIELAAATKTTQRMVSSAERGGGTLATLIKMAEHLGLRLDARTLPSASHLGERLAALRHRLRLGRRVVAAMAGISVPAIERLEQGQAVHLSTVEAIADALGVDLILIEKAETLGFFKSTGISSKYHGWTTPQWILDRLHTIFGTFDIDPCSPSRTGRGTAVKARRYYIAEDGDLPFQLKWDGTIFINPPFGRVICKWVEKCRTSSEQGATVVALLPSRVETNWWFVNVVEGNAHIFQLRGRLSYGDGKGTAPFASALVLWTTRTDYIRAMCNIFPEARYIPPLPIRRNTQLI